MVIMLSGTAAPGLLSPLDDGQRRGLHSSYFGGKLGVDAIRVFLWLSLVGPLIEEEVPKNPMLCSLTGE